MSGKGSKPRPFSVPQEEFNNSFETIFGKKESKPRYVPPPLPETKDERPKTDFSQS
jgi:hypothetical protein